MTKPRRLSALVTALAACVLLCAAAPAESPVPVPEPSPLALRYYHTGNLLWAVDQVWDVALPALILASGLSVWMRERARRLARDNWFLTVAGYVILYLVAAALATLPLAFYQSYVRPHAYGLSNQDPARWLEQWGKSLGVTIVTAVLFAWIPLLLIARLPRRWWLAVGLLSLPFTLFGALIKPVLVDPLFNTFGPMRDPVLERSILDMAARAGIADSRVFVVDKSRDTKAVNAYVTGLSGTKRIVLWDTLLEKLEPDQVQVVMAHEMGHYVLGHVWKGVLMSSALTLVGLFAVQRLAQALLARWGARLRLEGLGDVAAAPLLLACGQVVALLLIPAGYAFSRHQEHEADRFALELTHANRAGALAFVGLQRENLSNPRPGVLYRVWRGTHPSLGERIEFFNTYRPWEVDSAPSRPPAGGGP